MTTKEELKIWREAFKDICPSTLNLREFHWKACEDEDACVRCWSNAMARLRVAIKERN